MPELPEVEVVRRGLAEHVVGRRIETARFFSARVVRRHALGAQDLSGRLAGQRVAAANRRGKYLWLDLEPAGGALIVHVGMSGQLLVQDAGAPAEKHLHALFDFGDGGTQLRFVDQRTFGGVAWSELVGDPWAPSVTPPRAIPVSVRHIAPDPLDAAFDRVAVVAAMRRRDSAVKRALLDQSLVSGIGNIYADEALWRAGVHGQRLCSGLTRPALARILEHARDVMLASLEEGGTSFDATYVNVNGASGSRGPHLSVHPFAGHPCKRCGTLIVRERFMNRSSYFCPVCQRKR